MSEHKDGDRCKKCHLLLVELCKNCKRPSPTPWHDERNTGKTHFEGSGIWVCVECTKEAIVVDAVLKQVYAIGKVLGLKHEDQVAIELVIKQRYRIQIKKEEYETQLQEATREESPNPETSSSSKA